jgi:uncharacterized FAD-dependent dehydrogenase
MGFCMPSNDGLMWLRVENIALALEQATHPAAPLRRAVAERLGVQEGDIAGVAIAQRAIDARRQNPKYSYTVDVAVPGKLGDKLLRRGRGKPRPQEPRYRLRLGPKPQGPRPVVVGAGPAGLFAALTLAEAGWPPILLERGRPVETRSRDVSRLYAHGELNQDSNVCFGEGGAGTYSDGKLYTRVGDARIDTIMDQLVAYGASDTILTHNRPHIGTDKLVGILKRIRERLLSLGADIQFDTTVDTIAHRDGALTGFGLTAGGRIDARAAVLATGHSARHIWHRLEEAGVVLEARPFAMGFRIEHPQALINEARYGQRVAAQNLLPAADYRLTHNEKDERLGGHRGVFSFCMCPGGVVVTTPTEPDALCINGMSHASRQGKFANSAMVVSVGPEDFAAAGHTGTYAGVDLQEQVERAAYRAGGGQFVAPASRVADFVAGRASSSLPSSSYRRGLAPTTLDGLYPETLTAALRRALGRFDRSIRGFVSAEAVLIGVETRTAAPVRVPRGEDGMAVGLRGVYPAGEGMGYGGGIVSAAVDGVRAAEALLAAHGAHREAVTPPAPVCLPEVFTPQDVEQPHAR